MALIICEECGKKFSNRATACPDCACPVNQDENLKETQPKTSKSKATFTEYVKSLDNSDGTSEDGLVRNPSTLRKIAIFILFAAGLGALTEFKLFSFSIMSAAGLLLIPNIQKNIAESKKFKFSKTINISIALIGFFIGGAGLGDDTNKTTKTTKQPVKQPVKQAVKQPAKQSVKTKNPPSDNRSKSQKKFDGLLYRARLEKKSNNESKAFDLLFQASHIKALPKQEAEYAANIAYKKGFSQQGENKKEDALSSFQKVVKLNPDFKDAKTRVKTLKTAIHERLALDFYNQKDYHKFVDNYNAIKDANPEYTGLKSHFKIAKNKIKEGIKNKLLLGKKPVNSAWDASVSCVKDFFNKNLNDPDVEYVEWSPVLKYDDTHWGVRVKYRAKNGFGAKILKNQLALIQQNQVVKLIDL